MCCNAERMRASREGVCGPETSAWVQRINQYQHNNVNKTFSSAHKLHTGVSEFPPDSLCRLVVSPSVSSHWGPAPERMLNPVINAHPPTCLVLLRIHIYIPALGHWDCRDNPAKTGMVGRYAMVFCTHIQPIATVTMTTLHVGQMATGNNESTKVQNPRRMCGLASDIMTSFF